MRGLRLVQNDSQDERSPSRDETVLAALEEVIPSARPKLAEEMKITGGSIILERMASSKALNEAILAMDDDHQEAWKNFEFHDEARDQMVSIGEYLLKAHYRRERVKRIFGGFLGR